MKTRLQLTMTWPYKTKMEYAIIVPHNIGLILNLPLLIFKQIQQTWNTKQLHKYKIIAFLE